MLVIGGGAAGLAAALTAVQRGLRVVLVEKQARLGGSTALSIGSFSAAGTRWQKAKGIDDRVEDFIEDMARFPGVDAAADNPALRALLAAEAGSALAWLDRLGVPFVGTFPESPHRVERMHNVVPDSRMYIDVLERHARRAGVAIVLEAAVAALSFNEAGAAAGADIVVAGETINVSARHAVVLATGDFSGNAQMRRYYLRPQAATAIPANPNANGDGHRLAEKAGAQLAAMNVTSGPKLRFVPGRSAGVLAMLPRWRWLMRLLAAIASRLPPGALRPFVKSLLVVHMQPSQRLFEAGAILVNQRGVRFSDEKHPALDLAKQPEAAGYLIFDQRIRDLFTQAPNHVSTAPGVGYAFMGDYERARPDLFRRGETSVALARQIGADAPSLHKALQSASTALQAPYIAMGPVVSTITTTEGGLVVDRNCAVQDGNGAPIPGLYAAGSVAQSGMSLSGHGLHIAWAVVSGRIAGMSVGKS